MEEYCRGDRPVQGACDDHPTQSRFDNMAMDLREKRERLRRYAMSFSCQLQESVKGPHRVQALEKFHFQGTSLRFPNGSSCRLVELRKKSLVSGGKIQRVREELCGCRLIRVPLV